MDLGVFDRLGLEGISCGLDLAHRPKAKDFQVRRPEELFVVSRVDQLLFDIADRSLYIADSLTSVPRLQLADLGLMVKDRVLEDLLNVFVAYFGRLFAWGAQMLAAVHGQIDLCIAKVFWLVV